MAKTIAAECVEFINLGIHPENMEISEVTDGKEHYYTDNGEEIVCPICGALWLLEEEGEFSSGSCEHLRFTLCSERDDDFEFFGDWDSEGFLELVGKARENYEEVAVLDILDEIRHPDINRAVLYVWQDDPLYHPWTLWGFKVR